jgi:DNA polymerase elongation subunit (family B)
MWLKKPNATDHEYKELCEQIEEELELPISFEGRYKWIVFLNSRINPKIPVLNRYYGVFEDGTLKVRGIDLRRHDTPEIVRKCQKEMLDVLAQARDSREFIELVPEALAVMRAYVSALKMHKIPTRELVLEKRLSKMPNEYRNLVPQAIAARHLLKEGGKIHAGQNVSFVMIREKSKVPENRSLPVELISSTTPYDVKSYVDLVLSSAMNLLLPLGYDLKSPRELT